jgi:regulator of cell morphogenesis and NO signaling
MRELPYQTLAQIVIANHRASYVFEKYNLDFCCKGKRTLQQACEEDKLPVEVIVAEIENTNHSKLSAPQVDFTALSLGQLSEYIIQTHHSYVKKELPVIMGYLQTVLVKYGEHHPELFKVFALFAAIKEEIEYQMQREEEVLFPRIREIERMINEGKEIVINNTYLLAHVNMMQQEHGHTGHMFDEIKQLTSNYNPPADACTTFRLSYACLQAFELDLHHHMHLENNVLFPKALRMFDFERVCSLN